MPHRATPEGPINAIDAHINGTPIVSSKLALLPHCPIPRNLARTKLYLGLPRAPRSPMNNNIPDKKGLHNYYIKQKNVTQRIAKLCSLSLLINRLRGELRRTLTFRE